MTEKLPISDKLGKEVHAPVEVQGVFRDWMIKRMLRPAYVHSSCRVCLVMVIAPLFLMLTI